MCAYYSGINLVNQDSSGWGVYEDFAITQHYRGCGTGITSYEDLTGSGGEVREVTGIMQQS
jgi:hypothetical protein